jgi:hypothetical protein
LTFVLCRWIPEDLKPERALLLVAASIQPCVNNFGNWRFPNGRPGCCLPQLSTASFQCHFRDLKDILSSGCSL